ncbi:PAS domain S-box protein [Methylocystis sp. Sn-Cys]|uniref:hybrid sensor histidine kinase/response regulator n=1 Tax=Methylocystis sp. Sn-Cys TaxID=1701263 RepID=UPI001920DD33|nr:PAS domain S-box protein [Methylocystis sp. Sn-Cys]MBL1258317.1 PAS domain S-box protein [Methylocystis sp. Sn-Cys]
MENLTGDHFWLTSWASDPEGRASYVDPAWSEFTGQSLEQARAGWIEAVHPEDRERVGAAWTRAFNARAPYRAEYRVRRFDGVYHRTFSAAAPRFDESGVFQGYIGSVVDIEARCAAEDALRESEERFRALTESYAQAVWEADAHGAIVSDSPSWRAYTGQTLENFLGYGWLDAVHPDDRAHAEERWREAVAMRAPYDAEYRLKWNGGGWRWTNVRGAPLFDRDGSVRKWVGVNFDIHARKLAQEALRESESLMRLAQDAAHAGSWEWSTENNRAVWSKNLWALYGLDIGACEASFENWAKSIHEDDRERVTAAVLAAGRAGEEFELQWRVNLPSDQAPRWLLSRGRPVMGPDGAPERYYGVVLDVSELKNAEEALRASERRYRLLYESQRDPFVRVAMDGRILEVNDLYRDMLGYSDEELRGLTYQELTPEKWHAMEAAIVREQILPRGYSDVYEKEYRRKDGGVFPVELRTVLSKDGNGAPDAMWGIVRDISDRKLSEQILREREERLRIALDAAKFGSFAYYPQSGKVVWDAQMKRIWGLEPDEDIRFEEAFERIHPADRARVRQAVEACLSPECACGFQAEFRVILPDGSVNWHGVSGQAYFEDGPGGERKPVRMTGVEADITDRKNAEEALRDADRRKDELIAMLAHELRNPLVPIHNGVHLLRARAQRGVESDPQLLDMMERQVTHLVRLVDDLLEISRIARGRIELRREPTDIATVLRNALETSRPSIEKGRHGAALSTPPETLLVYGDPVRLTQVFANILNNAAKYTPEGGRIEILAERRGREAVVIVRDNGRGMGPEALSHVFEPFAQTGNPSNDSGLGIGLTLVRKLVELHGGSIEAASEGLGRGSVFMVRLPVSVSAADAAEPAKGVEARAAPAGRRALVIDDERDVADTLAMVLDLLGASVRVTYGGRDGLREVTVFQPDIVFLDLGMPLQDGFETARLIRQSEIGRRLTLVALTGWGQAEDRAKTREAGFDAHLTKPASLEALRSLLQN